MPAAWVGAAAAVGSLALAASNSGGSGSPGSYGGSSWTYIPNDQPSADEHIKTLEKNLYDQDLTNQNDLTKQYQTQVANLINNPYAQSAQDTSNTIAGLGPGIAGASFSAAGNLQGLSNAEIPYASQILQTGFDPQNALYDRTQAQLRDQTNAQNAMSGLSGSPYGAGVANEAMKNFNIDWQNTQLGRESQALQGYGSAINSIGQGYSGAQALGAQGLNTLQMTGSLPYQTYQGIQSNNIGALNALGQGYTTAQQPTQNLINDYNAYLQLGQAATGQALAGQNQAFLQGQTTGSNIGQGLAGLSSAASGLKGFFNSSSGYSGDGNYVPASSYDYYASTPSSGDAYPAGATGGFG